MHAEIYQGPWAGFTVRWSYWFCQTIAIGGEVVASGLYVQHWFPQVPLWLPVVALSGMLVAVNAIRDARGRLGRFELLGSRCSRVLAIMAFIVFGAAILVGLRHADVRGLGGYRPLAPMGWGAVWLAVPVVMFSYSDRDRRRHRGRAKDPERAVPRALRTTVVRLIIFMWFRWRC